MKHQQQQQWQEPGTSNSPLANYLRSGQALRRPLQSVMAPSRPVGAGAARSDAGSETDDQTRVSGGLVAEAAAKTVARRAASSTSLSTVTAATRRTRRGEAARRRDEPGTHGAFLRQPRQESRLQTIWGGRGRPGCAERSERALLSRPRGLT